MQKIAPEHSLNAETYTSMPNCNYYGFRNFTGLIERDTTRMASELQSEGFPKLRFQSSSVRFKVTFFKQIAKE